MFFSSCLCRSLVARGAEPILIDSSIKTAIPAAPPTQPSILESHSIPSDITPPTALFDTIDSPPSSFTNEEPTKATATLYTREMRQKKTLLETGGWAPSTFAISHHIAHLPRPYSYIIGRSYHRYRLGLILYVHCTRLERPSSAFPTIFQRKHNTHFVL